MFVFWLKLKPRRAYNSSTGIATSLTARQSKAHSALHTLDFIEQHYVRDNENSVHTLWTQILLHTNEPMTNIYNWVGSFELPIRRLTQCQRKALQKSQASRLRTLIAKQMTDAEKLINTTVDTSLTADLIDRGTYILDDLKIPLAKHIARFDAVYSPSSSTRIMRYLRNWARDFQVEKTVATSLRASEHMAKVKAMARAKARTVKVVAKALRA